MRLERKELYYFLIALVCYLPTLAYVPLALYLVLVIPVLYQFRKELVFFFLDTNSLNIRKINKNFLILSIIFLFSLINRLCHFDSSKGIANLYGQFWLIPLCFLIGGLIANKKILKWLIYFTVAEVIIGILEYTFGVYTFIPSLPRFAHFPSYQLLYYTRVLGLSVNSSNFALKILLAIFCIDLLKLKGKVYQFIKLVLVVGLVITFGRTILIVFSAYLFTQLVVNLIKKNYKKDKILFKYQSIFFLFFFGIILINPQYSKYQFTRGGVKPRANYLGLNKADIAGLKNGKYLLKANLVYKDFDDHLVDLSGRTQIWSAFIYYIEAHPLWGNGSRKLKIGKNHAHNSYLELIATNGIPIAILYAILIFINIRKENWIYIFSILLLSCTQYTIFWAISYGDILFYFFLAFALKLDYGRLSNHQENRIPISG